MTHTYNIDCMKALRNMNDKSIDLAVVDPPYFTGPNQRGFYGKAKSTTGIQRVNYPKTDDWDVPDEEYFEELFRVSKHQIIWGCNYFNYLFGTGRIIWDKCNGSSSFSDCEIAYCSLHDSVRLFRYMWNGMMQGKSIAEGHIAQGNKRLNEKRIHPTQKPINLYRWILRTYAQPGMTILDTHLGSQSSRIAAWEAGLEFIGFEKNEIYFELGNKRFEEYTAQIRLEGVNHELSKRS
ncbi:MAG: site-specific DNA-methyltransferase [Clostridia bacterium]|nr:site-specific DNA-methyltransferase [Clostridia bacterium]